MNLTQPWNCKVNKTPSKTSERRLWLQLKWSRHHGRHGITLSTSFTPHDQVYALYTPSFKPSHFNFLSRTVIYDRSQHEEIHFSHENIIDALGYHSDLSRAPGTVLWPPSLIFLDSGWSGSSISGLKGCPAWTNSSSWHNRKGDFSFISATALSKHSNDWQWTSGLSLDTLVCWTLTLLRK